MVCGTAGQILTNQVEQWQRKIVRLEENCAQLTAIIERRQAEIATLRDQIAEVMGALNGVPAERVLARFPDGDE